jgi:hypothetical protein
MTANDVTGLIRDELATVTTQWNLGTFGAIAEFLRDPGEPVELGDGPSQLFAVTDRGGIGFDDLSEVRPFASETAVGSGWSHRVALCLPEAACAMHRRSVLTELGPDEAALRPQDRAGILFDMGLGTLQVDICIRTDDPELIATLRSVAGKSLFEAGNPAMGGDRHKGPAPRLRRPRRPLRGLPADPARRRQEPGRAAHPCPAAIAAQRPHACGDRAGPERLGTVRPSRPSPSAEGRDGPAAALGWRGA